MPHSETGDYDLVDRLAEEFTARFRNGEQPVLQEYLDRFPHLADDLREMLPAMVELESVKADVDTPAKSTVPALSQLGDFRILREIGSGGMGVVYEAEQISLGRRVALKVLPQKLLANARQMQRFEREAKSAAKLHHTNIVPVFGVGEHDGLPFYVMQFIQGLGLDQVLDELTRLKGDGLLSKVHGNDACAVEAARSLVTGQFQSVDERTALPFDVTLVGPDISHEPPLVAPNARSAPSATTDPARSRPPGSGPNSSSSVHLPGQEEDSGLPVTQRQTYWQSIARVGVQVAAALEYAHQQGIVHRDVKPSNLLLDTRGTIWVTDFGLAKADDQQDLTHTGDILGTLRYMSPEAFSGTADGRSDLYSLGLTLYEFLALQPAFDERERHRLIQQVTSSEIRRLETLARDAPRDLITIVHKAIEREPEHRYQSAAELAADLQRFINDEPIRARPLSSPELFVRWCRRNPTIAGLSAALLFLLLVVTAASLKTASHFDQLARHQAQAARNERQARLDEQAAKRREAGLRIEAENNLAEAKAQRIRAEANFETARAAVDDFFTKVSEDQLLQSPGLQTLRRDLLVSALKFYQEFLEKRGDDQSIRAGLAAAHYRVGDIRSELGETTEANASFEQARSLYSALLAAAPSDVELRHGLAQCEFRLDRNLIAIEHWTMLTMPDDPRFKREIASAHNARAVALAKKGKQAEALEAYQQALVIQESLLAREPNDPELRMDLAMTMHNIATSLRDSRGRVDDDCVRMIRRAAEHAEASYALMPQIVKYGEYLTSLQVSLGEMESELEHSPEARRAFERSVTVAERLARDNPAVVSLQILLMNAYSGLRNHFLRQDLPDEAERVARRVYDLVDRLPQDDGDSLFFTACVRAYAATHFPQKDRQHELTMAQESLQRAVAAGFRRVDRIESASTLDPLREREDFKRLMAGLRAIEQSRKHVPSFTPAEQDLKAGEADLALRQMLAEAAPSDNRLKADVAASRHAIGLAQFKLERFEDASESLNAALADRQELAEEGPADSQAKLELATTWSALADVSWRAGAFDEGVKQRRKELEILSALVKEASDDLQFVAKLNSSERCAVEELSFRGMWEEAAVIARRTFEREKDDAIGPQCFDAVLLSLLAGERGQYRAMTQDMLERLDSTENIVEFLRSCTLSPDSAVSPDLLLKLAEQRKPWPTYDSKWLDYNAGAACYRAGEFERARVALEATAPDFVEAKLILAMACHQLDRTDEAERLLQEADAWYEDILKQAIQSPDLRLPTRWLATMAAFEVLRAEAGLLIEGRPFDHRLKRMYRRRVYLAAGKLEEADAEFLADIESRPNDPIPLILRGHFLLELGRHEEADASFADATALTPDVLNRFLEAGWRVTGPIPLDQDLTSSWPVGIIPDPSEDSAPEIVSEVLEWRRVLTGAYGQIEFDPSDLDGTRSVYALNYIYSPDERTAALLVGAKDKARVWLNGRVVHRSTTSTIQANFSRWLDRVPVTLRAGRNTLFIKLTSRSQPELCIRLDDCNLARGYTLAQLGLWDDAATLLRASYAGPDVPHGTYDFAGIVAASRDKEHYSQLSRLLFDKKDDDADAGLLFACALANTGIAPERMSALGRKVAKTATSPGQWQRAGLAMYRAGRYEEAIGMFGRAEAGHDPTSYPALALASHKLGNTTEARRWLAKATAWYGAESKKLLAGTHFSLPITVSNFCMFQILYAEARAAIEGADPMEDANRDALQARARRLLDDLDAATSAFDLAILLDSDEPRLYLARAHRLSELNRDEEAQADLAKATALKPGDRQVLKRRGQIYAELGRHDKATADFIAAMGETSHPGRAGLWFDGETYISTRHIPIDSYDAFTVEAWVWNWKDNLLWQGKSGDPENSLYLALNNSNTSEWKLGTGWEQGVGDNFPNPRAAEFQVELDSGWNHVALVYDGRNQRLFANGKLLWDIPALKPGPFDSRRRLFIGGFESMTDPLRTESRGLLNSVRISRVARYTNEFTPKEQLTADADTVLFYDFSEPPGPVVKDRSGNGNVGALHGALQYVAAAP